MTDRETKTLLIFSNCSFSSCSEKMIKYNSPYSVDCIRYHKNHKQPLSPYHPAVLGSRKHQFVKILTTYQQIVSYCKGHRYYRLSLALFLCKKSSKKNTNNGICKSIHRTYGGSEKPILHWMCATYLLLEYQFASTPISDHLDI